MRAVLALAALLVVLAAAPARAQSGVGTLHGLALPESDEQTGRAENWTTDDAGDGNGLAPATVELIPVFADERRAPRRVRAVGIYGRYRFGQVPMGLYRLRVSAPGYQTWEAETYIASDSESVVHVLLHVEAKAD